jgi:hypothetical protein
MKRTDQEYFRERERSERAAAKNSACPNVRRVHQELAQTYAALARGEAGPAYVRSGSRPRRGLTIVR